MILDYHDRRMLLNLFLFRAKLVDEKCSLEQAIALVKDESAEARLHFSSGSDSFSTVSPVQDMVPFLQDTFREGPSSYVHGEHRVYGRMNTRAHYLYVEQGGILGVFGKEQVFDTSFRRVFVDFKKTVPLEYGDARI